MRYCEMRARSVQAGGGIKNPDGNSTAGVGLLDPCRTNKTHGPNSPRTLEFTSDTTS